MVNFDKLVTGGKISKIVDPLKIFEQLDKESSKRYMRKSQESILNEWHTNHKNNKNSIIKLHTGEGKTLIGLLILQSSLNDGFGPGIFLCPNQYLVKQIIMEAKLFGIKAVTMPSSNVLPLEFLNSKAILVITCQKLFNGKSIFGVSDSQKNSINIGTIVIDDAHKCIEIIRDAFSIKINKINNGKNNPIYKKLWNLFETELSKQAPGTTLSMMDGDDSSLAVPYWSWIDKQDDVLKILNEYKKSDELFFVWDILRNELRNSICIFSGSKVQISSRLLPIDKIPSFIKSKRRIFLSATLMKNDVLIRDFGIEFDVVTKPLIVKTEKYYGERLILIPTLMSESLEKNIIIKWLSKFSKKNGNFGIFALVPSFKRAENWKNFGGLITNVKSLSQDIDKLKTDIQEKNAKDIHVLVNEYDGIDLPDDICRILCLDSLPMYNSLVDTYIENMRPNSDITLRRQAERIEQGIGRGIRGNGDWCIVIIIEDKLTYFLSQQDNQKYFSSQTRTQFNIATKLITEMQNNDIDPLKNIETLAEQCIKRDDGWKTFYHETMETTKENSSEVHYVTLAKKERDAELCYKNNEHKKAVEIIQELINNTTSTSDKGWYYQIMATYLYNDDGEKSTEMQIKAHKLNNELFLPPDTMSYSRIINSTPRSQKICDWIKTHKTSYEMHSHLYSIFGNCDFNNIANTFERGIKELGEILGFNSSRPEKQIGAGPDNLWKTDTNDFMLISCKNEVGKTRTYISKKDADQLLGNIAWFKKEYSADFTPLFFHPATKLDDIAHLDTNTYVITPERLKELKNSIIMFYKSFKNLNISDITTEHINQKITIYKLDIFNLKQNFLIKVK